MTFDVVLDDESRPEPDDDESIDLEWPSDLEPLDLASQLEDPPTVDEFLEALDSIDPEPSDPSPTEADQSNLFEERIWSDRDGRSIVARLVRFDGRQATIFKPSSGREYVVDLERFSDEHRQALSNLHALVASK